MDNLKIIIALVLIAILLFVGITFLGSNLSFLRDNKSVTIDGHTFSVTVANSAKDKEVGLSATTSLSENQGMYFPFQPEGYYAFWMKNMKFPIDIIFIHNNHIITIYSRVPAPTSASQILPIYKPTEPTDSVLEISSGLADKYNFKVGDSVKTSL